MNSGLPYIEYVDCSSLEPFHLQGSISNYEMHSQLPFLIIRHFINPVFTAIYKVIAAY